MPYVLILRLKLLAKKWTDIKERLPLTVLLQFSELRHFKKITTICAISSAWNGL